MDDNKKSKRSYGYIGENSPKPKKEEKTFDLLASKEEETKEKEPKRQNKPDFKKKPLSEEKEAGFAYAKIFKIFFKIILFPFALLWKITKLLFSKMKGRGIFKKLILAGVVASLIGFVLLSLYAIWLSRDLPDPDKIFQRNIAESTKIYDRTGEHLLYEIFADEKRTLIDYEDIPKDLINGAVATEDTKFWTHWGIRPLSILRAVIMTPFRGRVAGTSTLTQQTVKNTILTHDRSIIRKLKELLLSIQLERKYSKEQILKIYFNEISYGSTNYGIESAAQAYFNKSAKDLELHESAALAGMVKKPTGYLNNIESFKERRNFVLRRMHEEGYITEEQKTEAQGKELVIEQKVNNDIKAPHFVFYVKQKLVEKYGESDVATGGLKVITSLNYKLQDAAERAVTEQADKYFEAAGANNASLVAMDPKNGQVLAMVGSRDFFDKDISGQFNVATLGKRQPGSSFKPIVYTAAFEKGYTPETTVFDVVTNFAKSGNPYKPLNYDLSEHGPVTFRKALQGSLNIPAVKAMYLAGTKGSKEFAARLGYSTLGEGEFGLSLVLGGGEVHLLEHVNAYTTFANGGSKFEPVSILEVQDKDGKTLQKWEENKGEKVLDKGIAAMISNVLSDDNARAYAFGTGGILTIPGYQVAAKTGTTNNYIDAWTIGYTPNLVAGVWGGNTDNSPMTRGYGGSKVAGPIWNQFMAEALKEFPKENFPAPPKNESTKAVLRGSADGGVPLRINKVTGKLATSSTPEHLIEEKLFVQPHSILHYVSKNDPQGDYPSNPGVDPQYSIWEGAIQDWIKRKQEEDPDWSLSTEEAPTEFDDEYSLEMMPSIQVIYPAPSSTIKGRQLDTDIRVSAPRGVTKVKYYIDNKKVGEETEHPYNLNYYMREQALGDHILTIIVEDDIGNRLEEHIAFTLSGQEQKPHAFWWKNNKSSIKQSQFPTSIFAELYKAENLSKVEVYASNGDEEILVNTTEDFDELLNGLLPLRIEEALEEDTWTFTLHSYNKEGKKTNSESIKIKIKE